MNVKRLSHSELTIACALAAPAMSEPRSILVIPP